LKNSISKISNSSTIRKELIKLSSKQADKQASEYPSGANQNWSEANVQH